MPEYLAPAVYVEEVSFRSKPLEGVSTSTTAFVGPTAIGPINDLPELITGVGDFERIYGATKSLAFGQSYLAHAVRAFFDNGGRRLYVARTFQPGAGDGVARGGPMVSGDFGTQPNFRFVARTPGACGNGRVLLREERTPTTRVALARAPAGSMIRIGVDGAATAAVLPGGKGPFIVPDGAQLTLSVDGATPVDVTFSGTPAIVSVDPDFGPGPIIIAANTLPLRINLSGVIQNIQFAVGTAFANVQQLANAINRELLGGFALADGTKLRIGSEVRGSASSIVVLEGTVFGFAANAAGVGAGGTVPDIGKLTVSDLATLLAAQSVSVSTALDQSLRIASASTGQQARLMIANVAGAPSAAAALGIVLPAAGTLTVNGIGSTTVRYFVKRGANFVDSLNAPLPADPLNGVEFLSLNLVTIDGDGQSKNQEDLAYDPAHPRYAGSVLALAPPRRSDALENRMALETNADTAAAGWPFTLRNALFPVGSENTVTLLGGDDGLEPTAQRYVEALANLQSIEDISIVAAPGSSAMTQATAIRDALITHVERRRAYQIAVLDTPPGLVVSEVRAYRASIDSRYAALYYPWIRVANPDLRPGDISTPRELDVPPSGFVCGIYARNDAERGVFKAPANEVVRGALGFETLVNFAQQEVLNPSGINALRFFPGRGNRVWGARLSSSDPEWKYVSLRRYFNYVEASIDRGTQWVVFEPNGERLWQRLRSTISDFLFNEWRSGALLGSQPAEAYFVRIDRTTMTQNDLDNGRLIVEVGIAVVNPAEFVIFRIGQKTAEARS